MESNYLAPYLHANGFSLNIAAAVIAFYGITVTLGSWLAGSLSTLIGPRKVMLAGGVIWILFEVLFLAVALPSHSVLLLALTYGFVVWPTRCLPTHFWYGFRLLLPRICVARPPVGSGLPLPAAYSRWDRWWLSSRYS
ncbi:hypothetical protein [Candidatus Pantoea formicae]|uniref:hypothetical protein n=1 Tax=Candidatus Pantoea formicae TaxID=2608355 RepID=UPI0034E1AB2B